MTADADRIDAIATARAWKVLNLWLAVTAVFPGETIDGEFVRGLDQQSRDGLCHRADIKVASGATWRVLARLADKICARGG